MKLVMDVGNSRIKWARVDYGRLGPGSFLGREEPIEAALTRAWENEPPPLEALVCSVAGSSFNERLGAWMSEHWRLQPTWFRSRAQALDIENAYSHPEQLGSDRLAALIGARGSLSGRLGVIDCGTAATLDAVDETGRHRGGLILPGLALARQSLLQRTDSIRDIGAASPGVLGRSTAECVANGTRLGLAGALERCMTELERALPGLGWIATGGEWPELASLIDRPVVHDPDLVLKGLVRVLEPGDAAP